MTLWHLLLDALNRRWQAEHGEPEIQDDPRLWQPFYHAEDEQWESER